MRLPAVLIVLVLAVTSPVAVAAPDKLSDILVDVSEEEQPVRDVLRRLQAAHGLNYAVSEELLKKAGTVTVQLTQVPLDDALDAICIASGLTIQFRGSIVIMLPADARPPLPRVKDGLVSKGAAATERLPTDELKPENFLAPRRGKSAPARPASKDDDSPAPRKATSMMVGNVVEIDLEVGRLQLVADGLKRDFYLAAGGSDEHSAQFDRLRSALAQMKKGHRVALLYQRVDTRSVMTDLIGGDHVRDAELPSGKRRARRGPPRLRKGDPKKGPVRKKAPLPVIKKDADGVLTGALVSYEGDVVKIKRGDGAIVDCYLPTDDQAARAKLEAVIVTTEPGAQLFMTYEEVEGKIVLRGGISEKR